MANTVRSMLVILLVVLVAGAQEAPEAARLLQEAQAKLQQRDLDGALASCSKAIELAPQDGNAYALRAYIQTMRGASREVISDCDKAIELHTTVPVIVRLRGDARAQLNDYDGAIADYTTALKANAQDGDALMRRANLRQLVGDLEGALEDYSGVTLLSPEYGPAYLSRADVQAAMGRYDAAMDDFEAALFSMPAEGQAQVYVHRGRARLGMGEADKAREEFDLALKMAPDDSYVRFSRGLYLYDVGDDKAAVTDLGKAIELDAQRHEYAWLYRCLARLRLGEAEEARRQMGAYLDARAQKEDWFVQVAGFLAGRVTEEAFLAAAETDRKHLARERRCEAYWYAGAVRLTNGDKEKAIEYFRASHATEVFGFIEYASAACALKRLGVS